MRTVDLAALKNKLVGVPGIGALTQTNIGGRMTFSFNGLVVGTDPSRTDDEIATAILDAADAQQANKIASATAATAAVPASSSLNPPPLPTQAKTMSTPAPGSFAASLKAMMDEAKSGLAQAQSAGRARVQEAVGKFADATVATGKVSESMAQQIEDAASSALADLGQISNEI